MKKILFLHGFFATGSCPMARALKEAFEGTAVVLTPDLPLHPKEALKEIRSIIDREQPDLLLGNSCGSFLAQMLAPVVGIPALLGNPYFMMTEFLKERIGEHEYKAPRRDGNQRLVIDEALIEEFAELETVQFDHCNPYYKDRVWGLFGEQDTLAHFSRPPLAPQGGTEGDSLHHRPGAARLASGQQLRLIPCPDAGSCGGHSCPARQSVFHDDGVSEGANRRA